MSRQNQTEWTCDRCGAIAVVAPDNKPIGWGQVSVNFFGMRSARDMDLCLGCRVAPPAPSPVPQERPE